MAIGVLYAPRARNRPALKIDFTLQNPGVKKPGQSIPFFENRFHIPKFNR